jgi:hypothetical protein
VVTGVQIGGFSIYFQGNQQWEHRDDTRKNTKNLKDEGRAEKKVVQGILNDYLCLLTW